MSEPRKGTCTLAAMEGGEFHNGKQAIPSWGHPVGFCTIQRSAEGGEWGLESSPPLLPKSCVLAQGLLSGIGTIFQSPIALSAEHSCAVYNLHKHPWQPCFSETLRFINTRTHPHTAIVGRNQLRAACLRQGTHSPYHHKSPPACFPCLCHLPDP